MEFLYIALIAGVVFVGYCIYLAVHESKKPEQIVDKVNVEGVNIDDAEESSADMVPSAEPETSSVPQQKKTKGIVCGSVGMIYMAVYTLYTYYVLYGAEVTNFGEVIGKAAALNMFGPFYYFLLAATLMSLCGVIGKYKILILFAFVATTGAFFILPGSFEVLLIPAILFLISYIRMAKK